ncbi:MAG: putative signal transducing protein [Thermoanaerobaculia bacterium]
MSTGESDQEWVEVSRVAQDAEADLIRGFLESEGIQVELDNRTFHMEPVNFGDMTGIRILAPAAEAERARALLEEKRREFDSARSGLPEPEK